MYATCRIFGGPSQNRKWDKNCTVLHGVANLYPLSLNLRLYQFPTTVYSPAMKGNLYWENMRAA